MNNNILDHNKTNLKELNSNKYGLVFGIAKHPVFKNDMILTLNSEWVGEPCKWYRDLYYQAIMHMETLNQNSYAYGMTKYKLTKYELHLPGGKIISS